MIGFAVRSLLVAILLALGVMAVASQATSLSQSTAAVGTYAYDDDHHGTAVPTHTNGERGPPAPPRRASAYDPDGLRLLGVSARRVGTIRPLGYDYDGLAEVVRSPNCSRIAEERGGLADWESVVIQRSEVAANTGPRMLGVGPWGQRVVDARAKLPGSWGPGVPNSKKVGTKWFDPAAPKANGVRIDQGAPGSSFPSQQVDHVIVRSGGNVLGPDGLPITGSIKQNPQAHIPLDDWLSWTSWNAP